MNLETGILFYLASVSAFCLIADWLINRNRTRQFRKRLTDRELRGVVGRCRITGWGIKS